MKVQKLIRRVEILTLAVCFQTISRALSQELWIKEGTFPVSHSSWVDNQHFLCHNTWLFLINIFSIGPIVIIRHSIYIFSPPSRFLCLAPFLFFLFKNFYDLIDYLLVLCVSMHTDVGLPQYMCQSQKLTLSFPLVSKSQSLLFLLHILQASCPSEFPGESCLNFPSDCRSVTITDTHYDIPLFTQMPGIKGRSWVCMANIVTTGHLPLFCLSEALTIVRLAQIILISWSSYLIPCVRIIGVCCVNSVSTKSWKKVSYVSN